METEIMLKLLADIRSSGSEDLCALFALSQPGALESGITHDYLAHRSGKKNNEYSIPQLDLFLSETYGVLLYQEQINDIIKHVANYSEKKADNLRCDMARKIPEIMYKQRDTFIKRATQNHVSKILAEAIFDLLEKYSGYTVSKALCINSIIDGV